MFYLLCPSSFLIWCRSTFQLPCTVPYSNKPIWAHITLVFSLLINFVQNYLYGRSPSNVQHGLYLWTPKKAIFKGLAMLQMTCHPSQVVVLYAVLSVPLFCRKYCRWLPTLLGGTSNVDTSSPTRKIQIRQSAWLLIAFIAPVSGSFLALAMNTYMHIGVLYRHHRIPGTQAFILFFFFFFFPELITYSEGRNEFFHRMCNMANPLKKVFSGVQSPFIWLFKVWKLQSYMITSFRCTC